MRLRALLLPLGVIGMLWVGAVWWPSRSLIADERLDLQTEQDRQLALVDEIAELNRISEIADDLRRDLEAVDLAIPGSPDVDAFVTGIAADADQSGVSVRLLSPTDILGQDFTDPARPVPAGMTAVSILISAEGEFEQIMAFIDALDAHARLVVIDGLTIATLDGGVDSISVETTLRIFNEPVANGEPSEAAPLAPIPSAAPSAADDRAPEVGS